MRGSEGVNCEDSSFTDYCFSVNRPHDLKLRKLADLVRCDKCKMPAFDIISLTQRHTHCPFCITSCIRITQELADYLSDPQKVRNEVLPVLREAGRIAEGINVTTTLRPIAADAKIVKLNDAHYKCILDLLMEMAPKVADAFLKHPEALYVCKETKTNQLYDKRHARF